MSVGLDIGSKTIKVAELNREGNSFRLRAAGAVAFTGNEVSRMNDDKEFASLAVIIKKLFHDAKISAKNINKSVSKQYWHHS